MRILITGYKGFIGQNMHKALADHDLVLYEWGDGKVDLDGVDRVIHLGAISSTTCTDERAIKLQNYDFSVRLISQCVERGISIQASSSASVYGIDNTTFKESDRMAPQNLYAKSKAAIETFCSGLQSRTPVQLFRYFNVFGPHEDHKGSQASPYHQFRKQKEERGVIRLFEGSREFKRDFVPVEQVIQTHIDFFDVKESGVWNVGTGRAKSFFDVAQEINGDIEWIPMPENLKASYQAYTCANMSKTNDTLRGKKCLKR
jgi:ADP-L-glycero-D-manno-heptose 6-epimerase